MERRTFEAKTAGGVLADPADLWKYLADYEAKTGGRVMAIPHNPNLSSGQMFLPKR